MKRKFAIFNLALMAIVQFTIAFQSFHAFTHKHEHKTEHSTAAHGKHIVTASEKEECHVCDFHFDFFTAPQQFHLKLDFAYTHIPYSYSVVEGTPSFGGSLFSLRGPPSLV
jgi:hypothetical protein